MFAIRNFVSGFRTANLVAFYNGESHMIIFGGLITELPITLLIYTISGGMHGPQV